MIDWLANHWSDLLGTGLGAVIGGGGGIIYVKSRARVESAGATVAEVEAQKALASVPVEMAGQTTGALDSTMHILDRMAIRMGKIEDALAQSRAKCRQMEDEHAKREKELNAEFEAKIRDRDEELDAAKAEIASLRGELDALRAQAANWSVQDVGVAVLNERFQYLWLNDLAARLNGKSVSEHLGRGVDELFASLWEAIQEDLIHVVETGETRRGVVRVNMAPMGATPDMRTFVYTYMAPGGVPGIGVFATFTKEDVIFHEEAA